MINMNNLVSAFIGIFLSIMIIGCQNSTIDDACMEKALEIIPNYMILVEQGDIPSMVISEWSDGKEIYAQEMWNIGKGKNKDENVNYLYSKFDFVWEHKVIDDNGFVLGTQRIVFNPRELVPLNHMTFENNLDVENKIFYVNWSGLSNDLLEILRKEELEFKLYTENPRTSVRHFNEENLVCKWTSSEESGQHECDLSEINLESPLVFITKPDLVDNMLLFINKKTLSECVWVEEE